MLDVISGLVDAAGAARCVLDGVDLVEYLPEERQRRRHGPLVPGLPALPRAVGGGRAAAVRGRPPARWACSRPRCSCPGPAGPSGASAQAVDQVIGAFGLERFRHHRTAELSTGTRRVVDLASIVLAQPRLLLLDEPTAGIAQREAEAFIPLLRRLHEVADTTIVLVEHDVPLVFELCSKVVVMELGRVVAAGTARRGATLTPQALAAYLGASDEALFASGPDSGERRRPTARTGAVKASMEASCDAGGDVRARQPTGPGRPRPGAACAAARAPCRCARC